MIAKFFCFMKHLMNIWYNLNEISYCSDNKYISLFWLRSIVDTFYTLTSLSSIGYNNIFGQMLQKHIILYALKRIAKVFLVVSYAEWYHKKQWLFAPIIFILKYFSAHKWKLFILFIFSFEYFNHKKEYVVDNHEFS